MRLYLVQHGEAVAKEIDPERPLSEDGGRDIRQLGEWLARRGTQVSRVLHSGKTRARQTAEKLAVAVAPDLAVEAVSGLAPKDPVTPFLAGIGDWAGGDTLVVGHQPFMGRLVSALLNCGDRNVVAYRPGTLVCLESDQTEGWLLVWVVRPESYRS
jgi:phosphohistidine phosphatase